MLKKNKSNENEKNSNKRYDVFQESWKQMRNMKRNHKNR